MKTTYDLVFSFLFKKLYLNYCQCRLYEFQNSRMIFTFIYHDCVFHYYALVGLSMMMCHAGCLGTLLALAVLALQVQLLRTNSHGLMVIRGRLLEHSSGSLMQYGSYRETELFTTLMV